MLGLTSNVYFAIYDSHLDMAVTFIKTGHAPSNKTRKYYVQLTAQAYTYGKGDKKVTVLKPIIDKISIVVPISDPDECTGYENHIKDFPKDKNFPEFETVSTKTQRYNFSMKWRHAGTQQTVLIQAHPKSSEAKHFLRFEFNPDKLGADGFTAFKEMLWNTFSQKNLNYGFLVKHARFTRLDIACDFINARAADLIVQGQGKGKKVVYYSAQNDMETTYLDKPKKKPSKAKVYDKLQQQTDMSNPTDYEGVFHARVEIQHGGAELKKLKAIHNVLKRVTVIHPLEAPVKVKSWVWGLFLDSCRYRGVEAALQGLPEDMRGVATKVVNKAKMDTWRPLDLWDLWSDIVDNSGLLKP